MNRQKGLAPILTIILIAVAIAGGFLIYQKQAKPAVAPQIVLPSSAPVSTSSATNSAETVNWKIYSSDKLDFTFKYPTSYELKETIASQNNFKGVTLEKDVTYQSGGAGGGNTLKTGAVIAFFIIPGKNLSEAALKNEYGTQIKIQKKMLEQKEGVEVIFSKQGNKPRHIFYTVGGNVLDISLNVGFETVPKQYDSFVSEFDQILSTFKFLDQTKIDETSNWKTEQVNISRNYSFNLSVPSGYYFNISIPSDYTIKVGPQVKDTLRIYDGQEKQVISIYNYAGGESSPAGKITIDGVPFTLDYYKEIKCLSDIYPTNWKPGTQFLLSIHVDCDSATSEQTQIYEKIIKSMQFNPALKKKLLGND